MALVDISAHQNSANFTIKPPRPHHIPPHPTNNTANMASAYTNLPDGSDDEFDEGQIDFTDIEDQFQVRLDEGLDAFVVIDGLPIVPEDSKGKLVKFVLRKLNSVGKVKEDGVHMPVGDAGKTEGYVLRQVRWDWASLTAT